MEVASVVRTSRSDRDLDAFGFALRALVHELDRDGAAGTTTDDVRRRVLVRMLRRTAVQVAHPG